MRLRSCFLFFLLTVLVACASPLSAQVPTTEGETATAQEAATEPASTEPTAIQPAAGQPAAQTAQTQTATVGQTVRATGDGVVEAADETIGAVRSGAAGALSQTKTIWEEVLTPMWQQFATAIPGLIKAIILLIAFWLIALFVSMVVRRALGLVKLDERAEKSWGMEGMLGDGDSKRSLEDLAAKVVKWLILLVGFGAFFQALELNMVAGPLQNVVDRILAVLPSLLQAAVILLVYWIVASVVRMGVSRGLQLIRFDERWGRNLAGPDTAGKQRSSSDLLGRLAFYLVLLFGLGPFLQALGQESLVTPLSSMMEKGLGFIPNVIAAVLLFFIGRVIALVVREVVTNFLAATGADRAVEKLGAGKLVGERKASQILGSIAYFFVFVPVLVAAVDALGIKAISEPVESTLTQLLSAVPLIFVAILLAVVGYFVAKTVGSLVQSLLEGIGADHLPERFGLSFLQPKEGQRSVSQLAGATVSVLILLFVAQQALATLELVALSNIVARFVAYLPELATGLAVILLGISLGGFVGRMVSSALEGRPHARFMSLIARYAVIFVGLGMGVSQLGLGEDVVAIVVAAVLGGAALGLGLAFGLGAKDRVKELVEGSNLLS